MDFLRHILKTAPSSNVHSENRFSRMQHQTVSSHGHPSLPSTLAAAHVLTESKTIVDTSLRYLRYGKSLNHRTDESPVHIMVTAEFASRNQYRQTGKESRGAILSPRRGPKPLFVTKNTIFGKQTRGPAPFRHSRTFSRVVVSNKFAELCWFEM